MNSRFMFYLFFLSSVALSMVFYPAFRKGYLSWKSEPSLGYWNFRSDSFRRMNDNLNDFEAKTSHIAKQNVDIERSDFVSEIPYTEYGNVSQCPPNIFKKNSTRLLQTWCRIAERYNISWASFYGSLLGVLRNTDIIPYDSDIDVLVDASDVGKLRRLEHSRNFDVKDHKTRLVLVLDFKHPVENRRYITCEGKEVTEMSDECSFTDPMGRLISGPLHIDLYDYYDKGNHIEDPSEKTLKRYEVKDFFPFNECKFLGIRCKCPQNPRKLLTQYFETRNLNPSKRCINGIWTYV